MSNVDRVFTVIELLARARTGLPLSVISDKLGLPKSSLHLILRLLIAKGYIRQDPATQQYVLTMRLLALGFRHLEASGLTNACQPTLDHLAEAVGEFVQMRIVDGEELISVAWAQGSQSALRYVATGAPQSNLHATACGAVWLASLSEEEAARLVLKHGFEAQESSPGRQQVRTLPELFDKLRKTRARGYGLNLDEGAPGVNAVAVAIKADETPGSPVIGALAIAGPVTRLPRKKLIEFVANLKAAASELSAVWPMQKLLARGLQPQQASLEGAVRRADEALFFKH